jgi:N-hydroxyarylamine O-acetyltransferase
MSEELLAPEECSRFLHVLGLEARPPGIEALKELTTAHLVRVPFENVSKLYRFRCAGVRGLPTLADHLDGIERHGLGGTCYANNYYFYRLLRTLGYEVALCGADMSKPDVHVALIASLDGREYIIDGGYGAPFLAPLPRDLREDHEIVLGRERYVLRPRDSEDRSRLEFHRDGRETHGYLLKPAPRRIGDFTAVIADSFDPAATFMNALVVIRFRPGGSLVLRNLSLTECDGAVVRDERIAGPGSLPGVLEARFSIPVEITQVAIEGIELTRDPWTARAPEE